MHFCCLGSGSRGNAYVVEKRSTTLLIDCGFSLAEIKRRLTERLLSPDDIDAVVISHEHLDHTAGLKRLVANYDIPVYMSHGTARALGYPNGWNELNAGEACTIGDFQVLPVAVPHDATEPVQFIIDDGGGRLGVMTDLGHIPSSLLKLLYNLNALIVESNYADEMLAANTCYPEKVKRRIAGDYGHLNNDMAGWLLTQIKNDKLHHVMAAHLSAENNTQAAVQRVLVQAINGYQTAIHVANQKEITSWLKV